MSLDEPLLFGRKTHKKRPPGSVSLLACEGCRQRKKKCDGVTPTCSLCQKRNEICVYNNKKPKLNPSASNVDAVVRTVDIDKEMAKASLVVRYLSSFQRENTAFAAVKSSFDYGVATNKEKLSNQLLATLFTSMAAIGARFQGALADADRLYHQARMNIMQQYDRVHPYVIATHYLQGAHAELKGEIESSVVSASMAENMAELWIRKGNPCEAGVDARSILLACISRRKEYIDDSVELSIAGQRLVKWLNLAEEHHWKYQAIRIQTQFCEAVDLLSLPFESPREALNHFSKIEEYNQKFQAFQSSILTEAFKKRIAMCTEALRANLILCVQEDPLAAQTIADALFKQISEDISMRDNHSVYNLYVIGQLYLRLGNFSQLSELDMLLQNVGSINRLAVRAQNSLSDLQIYLTQRQYPSMQVLLASDYFELPRANDAPQSTLPTDSYHAIDSISEAGYSINMFLENVSSPDAPDLVGDLFGLTAESATSQDLLSLLDPLSTGI